MKEEKIGFGIILRIGISLLPLLFGYSLPAVIWCAFNIAMSFIVYGPLTCVVSSLCAVCISMFYCGFFGEGAKLEGLFIALQAVFCAVACIWTIVGKKKFFHGVWISSISYLIPSFLSLKNAASNAGQSVAQFITEVPFQITKEEIMTVMNDPALQTYMGEIESMFDGMRVAMMILVPATLIISSVIVGYLVMWCISARLKYSNVKLEHSFSEIKIPWIMVFLTALSLVLSFLNLGEVSVVAINVFVIFISFMFFAGLSLMEYVLRKHVKSGFARILIHVAIFFTFSVMAGIVYIFMAFVDAFANFRKIGKRGQVSETEK